MGPNTCINQQQTNTVSPVSLSNDDTDADDDGDGETSTVHQANQRLSHSRGLLHRGGEWC